MRGRPSAPLRTDAEALAIAREHKALASGPVRRWRRVHDPADIEQVAQFALFKAARTWNPALGTFAYWGQGYMRTAVGQMRNAQGLTRAQVVLRMKKGEYAPQLCSTDEPIRAPSGKGTQTRGDLLPCPRDYHGDAEDAHDRAVILREIATIAARYPECPGAAAAVTYLQEGISLREAGARHGISREITHRWVERLTHMHHKQAEQRIRNARRNHRSPR